MSPGPPDQKKRGATRVSPHTDSFTLSIHFLITVALAMMAAAGGREKELNQPPTDGISSVRFGPTSANHLLAASWDKVCDCHRYPSAGYFARGLVH